jgi:glycogen(starch) synthase
MGIQGPTNTGCSASEDQSSIIEARVLRRENPIYYAAVAGDILGTYLRWKDGRRDERQTAATYSGQFFDLCSRAGRRGEATFPSQSKQIVADGQISIRSRPLSQIGKGVWFYVYQLFRAIWLFIDVTKARASDVIVMDGVTFFFMLTPLAWSGRRIFLSIHTVLWREGTDLKLIQRIFLRLDSWFLRRHCAGCLVASSAIASQVSRLKGSTDSIVLFNPTYEREDFNRFAPPNPLSRPFRIFYAGRIEADKGVFDLLRSFQRLVLDGRSVHLDYCGDGAALSSLREAIVEAGLSDHVDTHGHLNRPELLDLLDDAQVVVVPTRSGFPEGLNQVVIEAVLARRPVVTSRICPAIELVSAAVVEAEADKIESYSVAIGRLIDDNDLFAKKASATEQLREQFFDPAQGWAVKAYALIVDGSYTKPE